IQSMADYGCALGIGYFDSFAAKTLYGIDLSQRNIDWCLKNRTNPKHTYLCQDFIESDLPEKVDLVFSQGTIDNSYDIDAFLAAMVRNSKRFIFATFYRGWFP